MAYDQVESVCDPCLTRELKENSTPPIQILMPSKEYQTNFRRFSSGAISGTYGAHIFLKTN